MKDRNAIPPTGHLSALQLLHYRSGTLTAAQMHQAERHLLDCPLCSEALEGLEQLEAPQATAALADVRQRLASRLQAEQTDTPTPYWRWAVAASVLLLVAAAVFLMQETSLTVQQQLSRQEVQEERAPLRLPPLSSTPPASPEVAQQEQIPPLPKPAEALQDGEESPSLPPVAEAAPLMELEVADEEADSTPPSAPALAESLNGRIAGVAVTEDETRTETQARPTLEKRPPAAAAPVARQAARQPAFALQEKAQAAALQLRGTSSEATKVLKGKIVDALTEEPLPGVSIRLKGGVTGTVTDMNGEYALELPATDTTLTISFVGYADQQVAVDKTTTQLVAALEEDIESLSEVVVTGYSRTRTTDAPVTTPAQPAEGMRQFRKWVKENLRYPQEALQAGIEGTVRVHFFVEPNGRLSALRVDKPLGYGLDEEAIRLLQQGPAWEAATEGGVAVRRQASVRIPFRLPKQK